MNRQRHPRLISSQRYLDEQVLLEKIEGEDFEIFVSPLFRIDGVAYRVLMDGHHSLAAAREVGVEPDVVVMDTSMSDRLFLLEAGNVEGFLEAEWMGEDWYDVDTGHEVF